MKRSEVNNKFKWDLSDLYESDGLFEKTLTALLESAAKFDGKNFLNNSAALYECLHERDKLAIEVYKTWAYSHMKLDEDAGNSYYQGLSDKSMALITRFSAATAFIEPELLTLEESTLTHYMEENPSLQVYRQYLNNLFREKKHILSVEMETMLSEVSELTRAPKNIFNMLNSADLKFKSILDSSGKETEVTQGKYISLVESSDRRVRQDAFKSLYASYIEHKNTIAAAYNASVKKDIFYAKARHYNSALSAALSNDNIPAEVYTNLVETVNRHLPLLHRYVRLRKKRLGLAELHMYDLYTPIVKEANSKISYEDAKALVLEGLAPMGEDYIKNLKKGFNEGWIDVYENEGKHSGAYCSGVYSVHPYVLLNYDNKIKDMFTLAHEMGHAMHSYYSDTSQAFVNSDYTIFLAEIASTVNESLLMNHMLTTETDKTKRADLLNYYLEQFRGTLFRQTMFAEFEMLMHELAEKGEALTAESMSRIYRELNIRYYGEDIVADSEIDYEWLRIPHFYNAFYVYQYSTGYSAAIAFSKKILESADARDAYLELLKSGCSDYSIELLKKAGLDMSSPKPIADAMEVFEEVLIELENLFEEVGE